MIANCDFAAAGKDWDMPVVRPPGRLNRVYSAELGLVHPGHASPDAPIANGDTAGTGGDARKPSVFDVGADICHCLLRCCNLYAVVHGLQPSPLLG